MIVNDWETLLNIKIFVQSFYEVTKFCENRKVIINRVLSMLNFLLEKYKKDDAQYVDEKYMKLFIDFDWLKLQKYWNRIDKISIYIVVIILDSIEKWIYFERRWKLE